MKEKLAEGKARPAAAAPTELSVLLTKIGAASRVLNGAANDATRRIEAVEQSLLAAEPGVSVWGATLLSEKATYQRDEASPSEPALRVVTLGFAKSKKDKWGICVREELKVRKGISVTEELTLLRKAERNLRILALPHLEQLVREVLSVLEQQITVLDGAREGVTREGVTRENGRPVVSAVAEAEPSSAGASA